MEEDKNIKNKLDEEKKIYKFKLDSIKNQIENDGKSLKNMDKIEEGFFNIKKATDRCIELFEESIKGGNSKLIFDSAKIENEKSIKKVLNIINLERNELKKNLIKLKDEKSTIEKSINDNNHKSDHSLNNENEE